MKDCFNTRDLKLLNEGVILFEEIMLEEYPELSRDEIYLQFSGDFGEMKLPEELFTQAKVKAFLENVSSSGLSKKIWVRKKYEKSGFYALDQEQRKTINHYYSTSTELEFFKCMFSKVKEGEFAEILKVFKSEENISPDILAIGVTYQSEKTLQLNSLKVFIVYVLFYESAMTLNFQ